MYTKTRCPELSEGSVADRTLGSCTNSPSSGFISRRIWHAHPSCPITAALVAAVFLLAGCASAFDYEDLQPSELVLQAASSTSCYDRLSCWHEGAELTFCDYTTMPCLKPKIMISGRTPCDNWDGWDIGTLPPAP